MDVVPEITTSQTSTLQLRRHATDLTDMTIVDMSMVWTPR